MAELGSPLFSLARDTEAQKVFYSHLAVSQPVHPFFLLHSLMTKVCQLFYHFTCGNKFIQRKLLLHPRHTTYGKTARENSNTYSTLSFLKLSREKKNHFSQYLMLPEQTKHLKQNLSLLNCTCWHGVVICRSMSDNSFPFSFFSIQLIYFSLLSTGINFYFRIASCTFRKYK